MSGSARARGPAAGSRCRREQRRASRWRRSAPACSDPSCHGWPGGHVPEIGWTMPRTPGRIDVTHALADRTGAGERGGRRRASRAETRGGEATRATQALRSRGECDARRMRGAAPGNQAGKQEQHVLSTHPCPRAARRWAPSPSRRPTRRRRRCRRRKTSSRARSRVLQDPGPSPGLPVDAVAPEPGAPGPRDAAHQVIMRELVQTCVPVRKNNAWPPSRRAVHRAHRLRVYRLDARRWRTPVPINLTHLNPVLANSRSTTSSSQKPAQSASRSRRTTCSRGPDPRAGKYLDIECYDTRRTRTRSSHSCSAAQSAAPEHPPHGMSWLRAAQALRPVRKNNQIIRRRSSAHPLGRSRKFRATERDDRPDQTSCCATSTRCSATLPQVPVVLQGRSRSSSGREEARPRRATGTLVDTGGSWQTSEPRPHEAE